MTKGLKKGAKVRWETVRGTTTGKVVRTVTSTMRIDGHIAKASREEPQFVVESDKTGKKAVHKPESLKRG